MSHEHIKNSVGIIGCGWLGKALATELQRQGHGVKVTVRQEEKKAELISKGFHCECLTVPNDVNASHPIFLQHTLIIAITPGFKRGRTDYATNIASIVAAAELGAVKKIILVSSSGVYQDQQGNVDENTVIENNAISNEGLSDKSTLLLQAEQAVIEFTKQGKVLRLAGLVAEDRKPGKFLAGKTQLSGATLPVNLIHRDDCVQLLVKLIQNDELQQKIFIGVSRTTANKEAFYTAAAHAMNLIPPVFNKDNSTELSVTRKVFGENTRQWLNYQYQHDDLLLWLANT